MKKALSVFVKILVIAAILVPLALLLKDSSDQLEVARYDPAAPTASKLELVQRWLPRDAELVVMADLHRLSTTPGLIAKIAAALKEAGDVWGIDAGMVRSMLMDPKDIGLIAVALTLEGGAGPTGVAIVQGGLPEADMVRDVQEQLDGQDAKLVVEEAGGVKVYAEPSTETEFAFAFPDRQHMIVGPKAMIARILEQPRTAQQQEDVDAWSAPASGSPLFGRILITARLKSLLPPQIAGVKRATFSADGQLDVTVDVPCTSLRQAQDLALFIEGARAYVLLGGYGDTKIGEVMRGVSTAQSQHAVTLRIPMGAFLR